MILCGAPDRAGWFAAGGEWARGAPCCSEMCQYQHEMASAHRLRRIHIPYTGRASDELSGKAGDSTSISVDLWGRTETLQVRWLAKATSPASKAWPSSKQPRGLALYDALHDARRLPPDTVEAHADNIIELAKSRENLTYCKGEAIVDELFAEVPIDKQF
ncbi:hypothetical protein V8B97DRAFT_1456239 [Scleroderma yunnanense]